MFTTHKYRSEGADQTATLKVPQGFDPPPVLTIPIVPNYGSGVEVFELVPAEEDSNR